MIINQRVLGSSPRGGATFETLLEIVGFFCEFIFFLDDFVENVCTLFAQGPSNSLDGLSTFDVTNL